MGLAVVLCVSVRTEVERQRERAKRKGVGARRLHKSEARGPPDVLADEGSSSPDAEVGVGPSYNSLTGQLSPIDPHPHHQKYILQRPHTLPHRQTNNTFPESRPLGKFRQYGSARCILHDAYYTPLNDIYILLLQSNQGPT